MELSYLQNCPACGAPIQLSEGDRIIACEYCESRNYMACRGPQRFVLPDTIGPQLVRGDVLYIPYLRFKGHIYSCLGEELDYKIVDTTQLGYDNRRLPASLGLRPQAMKVEQIGGRRRERFVRLNQKVVDIFNKAARLTSAFSRSSGVRRQEARLYHRSFIGETISFIYLPTYFTNDTLMDGVLKRPITGRMDRQALLDRTVSCKKEWLPHFISARCPHCGAGMTSAADSLVQECHNCSTLWQEHGGVFRKIEYSFVDGGRDPLYLPFWRIRPRVHGGALRNFGDFVDLTNQPVVLSATQREKPVTFWTPAFKIRPKEFLHIAKWLTMGQQSLPAEGTRLQRRIFPATLPSREAVQALKAVLTEAVLNKRAFIPTLPGLRLQAEKVDLVYLPFHALGQDLVQEHTRLAISRRVLYYGRTM
ncbi:MAG: hypothetical protein ABR512_13390 [Desulfopila sp.]